MKSLTAEMEPPFSFPSFVGKELRTFEGPDFSDRSNLSYFSES